MPEEQTMDFSLIADYADVLAALGIIVTLGFVALQIKQNTDELRNTHVEGTVERAIAFFGRAHNKETATIIEKGQQSYKGLIETERLAFEAWMHEFVLGTALLWRLDGQGKLGPTFGDIPNERVRWMFRHPGVKEWWHSDNRVPITTNVIARIDDVIKSI